MSATCPFCLQSDLPEGARKCRGCGSWLDPAAEGEPPEVIRRAVQLELRSDVKDHRGYLESLMTQLRYAAGLVVAAALAATVYFGIRTDQSISATAARIAAEAETKIQTATAEVTAEVTEATRTRVAEAVQKKLDAPETAALIEAVLAATVEERVKAEVADRFAAVSAQVAAEVAASQAQLAGVEAEIGALRTRSQAALAGLEPIEASFAQTRAQTVATSQSVLPVQPVRVEGKGDMAELDALLRNPVEALSFHLGDYYYGPVVWAYMDRLGALPEFRHVVLIDPMTGALVGFYDADALAAALDPPDPADLRAWLANGQVPDEGRVARWSEFAGWVQDGNLEALAALPSFVDAGAAVQDNWPSLRALDHMERLGRDRLPVIDEAGAFVGVIDRSRLTTRVLLEIAGDG